MERRGHRTARGIPRAAVGQAAGTSSPHSGSSAGATVGPCPPQHLPWRQHFDVADRQPKGDIFDVVGTARAAIQPPRSSWAGFVNISAGPHAAGLRGVGCQVLPTTRPRWWLRLAGGSSEPWLAGGEEGPNDGPVRLGVEDDHPACGYCSGRATNGSNQLT